MLDLHSDTPKELYKFRSLANDTELSRLEEILVDNLIYWPSPVQFNDPFDCFPSYLFPEGKKLRSQFNQIL